MNDSKIREAIKKIEPLKCTVINKHLSHFDGGIIANPFEATKAWCIANAEGKLGKFLPYAVRTIVLPDDDPESCPQGYSLGRWRLWLSEDKFRQNPELFRKLVEPVDFSKPFDEKVAKEIDAQFSPRAAVKIEVDAVAIEEARNEQ